MRQVGPHAVEQEDLTAGNGDQLAPDLGVNALLLLKGSDGALVPGISSSSNKGSSLQHRSSSDPESLLGPWCGRRR